MLHAAVPLLWQLAAGDRVVLQPRPAIQVEIIPVPASPTPTPRPRPRARGDLLVPASPLPTPALTPTPTPRPSPSATPSPRPSTKPTPAPKRTPTPRPSLAPNEAEKFAKMRRIPYFAKMSDEQLRKMPLPPGLKDWGEVQGLNQQLDGLQWLFLPPETGPATAAVPSLWDPGVEGFAPVPVPSPIFSTTPEGQRVGQVVIAERLFTITHRPEEPDAEVEHQSVATDIAITVERFRVRWDDDVWVLLQRVIETWQAQQSKAATPSLVP